MTTLDVLKAARARISDPAKWCKGTFARHANGNPIGAQEENACRWCGEGAILAEAGNLVVGVGADAMRAVLDVVRQFDAHGTIHDFNDEHTHAEVLALFDKAIAAEQAKETK